jgi:hypothetical protein
VIAERTHERHQLWRSEEVQPSIPVMVGKGAERLRAERNLIMKAIRRIEIEWHR